MSGLADWRRSKISWPPSTPSTVGDGYAGRVSHLQRAALADVVTQEIRCLLSGYWLSFYAERCA